MRLTQAEIEVREVRRVIHQARHYAKNAVLHSIKAQGLRPANYSCKEIMIWTDLYFADHREALLACETLELRTATEPAPRSYSRSSSYKNSS